MAAAEIRMRLYSCWKMHGCTAVRLEVKWLWLQLQQNHNNVKWVCMAAPGRRLCLGYREGGCIASAASEIWLRLRRLSGCRREDGWKDYLESSWACLPDKIYFLQDNRIHLVLGSEESPLVFLQQTSCKQNYPVMSHLSRAIYWACTFSCAIAWAILLDF